VSEVQFLPPPPTSSRTLCHDEHLPISIEVRKTRTKEDSTVAGFFRQYELYYVVGDERDVIRVRTKSIF
jgi:hypothetical protein